MLVGGAGGVLVRPMLAAAVWWWRYCRTAWSWVHNGYEDICRLERETVHQLYRLPPVLSPPPRACTHACMRACMHAGVRRGPAVRDLAEGEAPCLEGGGWASQHRRGQCLRNRDNIFTWYPNVFLSLMLVCTRTRYHSGHECNGRLVLFIDTPTLLTFTPRVVYSF